MQNCTWVLGMMPLVFVLIKIITKQQVSVFVVIFLFSILGFLITSNEIEKRNQAYCFKEQSVVMIGRISKITETQYGFCVYLQNTNFKGKTFNQLIVYADNVSGLKIGNVVKVSGKLKQFATARNEGNFDSRQYYMSLGIYIAVSANQIRMADSRYDWIRQGLYQLKLDIKSRLDDVCNQGTEGLQRVLKEKNTVYEGILLGDKSDMDTELKELYSISGISHVLAISGLHISIIGMFLYAGLRKKFCFGVSASVAVIVVVMFGILSGMGIATIRALVMFGLKLLGEVIGRNYDYLTAISLAGLILLVENPFVIFNSGFQMSFAAIVSIVILWKKVVFILQLDEKEKKNSGQSKRKSKILYGVVKRKNNNISALGETKRKNNDISVLDEIKRKVRKSVLCSLTISVFMNPIVAYNYFSLPTYSFLLNVLVVPLMSVVVVSGVIGIVCSYIGMGVARLALFPGCFVLEMYERMCNLILKLPFSNVIVGKPDKVVILIYYLLVVVCIFFLEQRRKRKLRERRKNLDDIPKEGVEIHHYIENRTSRKDKKMFSASLILLVILLDTLLYGYFPIYRVFAERNQLVITAMDVGQGDGIAIRTPNNKVITVDGGSTSVDDVGKYRIIPFLKSQCISQIDYAVMTHADEDHISGLIEMMKTSDSTGVQVKHLVLPDIRQKDEAYQKMIEIAREHGVAVLYITKGNRMKFDHVEVKCVYPAVTTQAADRNDYSTVLEVTYNEFSMLLTGDISSDCETGLKDKLKNHYTVLKVAHHGSKYSTSNEFLQQINPDYSVISVGEHNLYGHPSAETLERLEQNRSQILRTDKSGEIKITTDGKAMKIQTVIKE